MIDRFKALFNRANDIKKTEGWLYLIKRIFTYYIFQYRYFYVYEHELVDLDESDFTPRLHGYSVKIISNNNEADDIATKKYDFRLHYQDARKALDSGAVAFCIFANEELAHIGWIAMNKRAKKYVDPLPFHVDFCNYEAVTGGTKTNPKYRGKGLMNYGYYLRFNYLKKHGIKIARNAVKENNIPSHKSHQKFKYRITAKARYLKILSWVSWKETPVT
jgi:hypothetical protein